MKKIKYEESSFFKQIFIILLTIYTILRLIIILQIKYYRIPNYYNSIHFPLTLILYAFIITVLIFSFLSYKTCCCLYDSKQIMYINRLIRRKNTVIFNDVHYVRFDKKGVHFYPSISSWSNNEKELFKIPFFRFGRIDPIDIKHLYEDLLNNDSIVVEKTYSILPGHGPRWKIVSYIYLLLSIIVFMNYAQPLKVIVVLFMNH